MPELPEVESIRLGLLPKVKGQTILKVVVFKPRMVSGKGNLRLASVRKAREFKEGLEGEKIAGIERKGKNLIFRMKSGKLMLVHLKMSGHFIYRPKKELSSDLPGKHARVLFGLQKGTLYYNDPRMFGYLLYFRNEGALIDTGHFEFWGEEPLSKNFTLGSFTEKIRSKRGKLKPVLMGQEVVVGLGNIYADEVCFDSGIKPHRKIANLSDAELARLYRSIVSILRKAVRSGGSSVRTYVLTGGERGKFSDFHKVYGRAGRPCSKCGTKLKKTVLGGRTTVFCVKCQK